MTKAPEIIKSVTVSLDGDVLRYQKCKNRFLNLAEKMELSKNAMKTITKIYHVVCLQGERAAETSGN
jgi:hypothetical protein